MNPYRLPADQPWSSRILFRTEVGSTAHGTGIDGHEDYDEIAVMWEPLRLGYQGIEYLLTGRIVLPMVDERGDHLRAPSVRGEIPLEEVLVAAEVARVATQAAQYGRSPAAGLRRNPPVAAQVSKDAREMVRIVKNRSIPNVGQRHVLVTPTFRGCTSNSTRPRVSGASICSRRSLFDLGMKDPRRIAAELRRRRRINASVSLL